MAERRRGTDVVVIGLGAAGGIAAMVLAEAGREVIGLEAGPRWELKDFPSDEIRNDVRNFMGNPKFNLEVPTSRTDRSQEATPTIGGALMMNGVGGSSVHYTCQSWRFLPWSFRMKSATIERYGRSALPENSLVEDWPVSYDELEPYYHKVERLLGVSGKAGNLKGKKDPAGNVLEGPRSREYPLPPLRRSGYIDLATNAAKQAGWHPFPGPSAIHSEPYEGQPGCQYCGFCTQNGCHTNAKGSVNLNAIPRAEKSGNLKVETGARVTEIAVDNDGRATGVTYLKDGKEHFQPTSLVILSGFVYENTRLLLLSKSKAFPKGLSNNAGQVGKGFMSHGFIIGSGAFDGKRLNRFGGPGSQYMAFDDFEGDNFDHAGLDFIGGAGMSTGSEAKPIATARTVPPSLERRWGSQWKAWMAKNGNSIAAALAQMEVLPYEDNFIDLDPKVKDPAGLPVARITFDYKQQEKKRGAFLQKKLEQWLKEMGAAEAWSNPPLRLPVNQHVYGGTRMGDDRDQFVVDKHSLSHEVPNLAILGTSTFLSTAGKNPTETLQALAWMSSEHIADEWNSIA